MKKIIAILLLISFGIQVAGYHLFFHIRKWEIKSSARKNRRRNSSRENELQFIFPLTGRLQLTNSQPEWEDDHEFRLNGHMYDVIEKRIVGDTIYVRCVADEKETRLIEKYNEQNKDDFSNTTKNKSGFLLKLINSLYTYTDQHEYMLVVSSKEKYRDDYRQTGISRSYEVLTPPPQTVLFF